MVYPANLHRYTVAMEGSGMSGMIPEDTRPHFFLSYARSRFRPDNDSDPDRWVAKLFNDLCLDVSHATGTSVPGFMDRQIPVGTGWPDHLEDALSKCRVFVALFSPAYFTSEYCGKEWAAFQERAERARSGTNSLPSPIIPAMWMPMEIDELPSSLQSLQNNSPMFPQAYAAEGLYGIMKLGRYRESYKETVLRLANLIKERATMCALEASPVSALDSLESPFLAGPASPKKQPVRLTLAAQSIQRLPDGRDAYYYGRTTREWSPYRSEDHTMPIGAYAEQILSELGHESIVTGIDDQADDAGSAEAADRSPHPAESLNVLIVDPWSARDPDISERLRKLTDNPTNVLAPFNSADGQTTRAAPELAADLETVLGESLSLPGSAKRIRTLDAFRGALPKAVSKAVARYFKTTETHPPKIDPEMPGPPKLQGPES
jgi:FxsC-like protein